MKYFILLCLSIFTFLSCQQDTKKTSHTTSQLRPIDEESAECFINQVGDKTYMEMAFTVEGGQLTGQLLIHQSEATIDAEVSGKFHSEEYVASLTYMLDGKKHEEMTLLTVGDQNASLARSGRVRINGRDTTRNNGNGSLDYFKKVECHFAK